jgi:hypothetical protein
MNRLYAGDTLEFGLDVPDYPPEDNWTLKMRLVPRFTSPAQDAIVLTAVTEVLIDGVSHHYTIQVPPSTTAAWVPGAYGWHSWVEKLGARVTLEGARYSGELTVLPDPATSAVGTDFRTPTRKAYDDAVAAQRTYLASKATVASYTIGDRSMTFHKPSDFVSLINNLALEVRREQRREALAAGLPDPRKIYVRACR